jgi:beta-lactamase regulating signal transducer with metallopeptidase domain
MSGPWVTVGAWVCHTAAGGGLLLLLAWALMRWTRQPARQQRLGECGLAAALLLAALSVGPAWLPVVLPLPEPAAVSEASAGPVPAAWDASPAALAPAGQAPTVALAAPLSTTVTTPADPRLDPARPPALRARLLGALGLGYVLVALFLAARWLLGHLALWRLLREAEPAPGPLARLFAELTAGRRPPRLLVSRRLRVPFSCGLWRPTVVLPADLCDDPGPLRWVFAHELTHLERRDPWTCVLFGLGQLVYFYLPWFWWARRQVGLCQEFIADAAVAAAEEAPEEYAQFLLGLTQAPAVPAGAASVAGRPSDLRRRLVMLLQAPRVLERRCPWLWSTTAAAGLATLAVAAAGVRLEATPAPPPPAALPAGVPAPPAAPMPVPDETPRAEVPPATGTGAAPPATPMPPPRAEGERPSLTPPVPREDVRPELPRPAPAAVAAPQPVPPVRTPWPEAGRLGVRVAVPDAVLVDQFDLPRGQGLVVADVAAGSPAARAGLRAHDLLLLLDGKPVLAEPWRLALQVDGLPGEKALTAVVLRRGRRETVNGVVLPSPPRPARTGARGPVPPGPPLAETRFFGGAASASLVRSGERFTAREEDGPLLIQASGAGGPEAGGWRR